MRGIAIGIELISIVIILHNVDVILSEVDGNGCDTHKWICTAEKGYCVRTNIDDPRNLTYYDNQNVCRLICGESATLWPLPYKFQLGKNLFEINVKNIRFVQDGSSKGPVSFLNEITQIFLGKLLRECNSDDCGANVKNSVGIRIKVDSSNLDLTWGTNECYTLKLYPSTDQILTVDIEAETVFGARNALETLAQLFEKKSCANILVMLTEANITDCPAFTHRGLMIDTARNFFSIEYIEKMLEAMSLNKMNVLHWHITDSQSFPMEIPSVPEMTKYGAYSSQKIYTQDNISSIIERARYYGIRVIIELDAPSHAGLGWQWGEHSGLGDLAVCVNKQPWNQYCNQPPCGQLNPVNLNTYEIISRIFLDIIKTIPSGESIHMGGDEVSSRCWKSVPEIVEYLQRNGKGTRDEDFVELWSEFQNTVLKLWDLERLKYDQSPNRTTDNVPTILWNSPLTDPSVIEKYLPSDRYIIQSWAESGDMLPQKLLEKGYRVIYSTNNAWYLDHGFWIVGGTKYYTWKNVYNNVIPRKSGVLGGEVCMWTEYVDEYAVDGRIWPRTAAFAERMWSDPSSDANEAQMRLHRQRERLITAGIRPEAILPLWCAQNDGECNM